MRRHKPLTVGREQPQHPSYHLVKMKTRVILIELTVLKHTKAVSSITGFITYRSQKLGLGLWEGSNELGRAALHPGHK